MCPVHQGGRVFGCKYCMNAISTLQFFDSEAITTYQPENFSPKPKAIEASAPIIPKAPVDPMIRLADLADNIDEKRRLFRVAVWRYALGVSIFLSGAALLVLGLFTLSNFMIVGGPVMLGGAIYLLNQGPPSTKYLAIHEARAEFARVQRRVGQ